MAAGKGTVTPDSEINVDFKCVKCSRKVVNGVKCTNCDQRVHLKCFSKCNASIKGDKLLVSGDDISEWTCEDCAGRDDSDKRSQTKTDELEELEELEVMEIKIRNSHLVHEIALLKELLVQYKENNQLLKDKVNNLEAKMRMTQECNEINRNVDESTKDTSDPERDERQEYRQLTSHEENEKKFKRILSQHVDGKYNDLTNSWQDAMEGPTVSEGEVLILGDSMIKVAGKVCEEKGCEVGVYTGVRVSELSNIIQRREDKREPKVIVIHAGTNNVGFKARHESHVMVQMDELLKSSKEKYQHSVFIVSGVIYRDDIRDETIDKINDSIRWVCSQNKVKYVDPNMCISHNEAARDGIHLNYRGGIYLGQFFMQNVYNTLEKTNSGNS